MSVQTRARDRWQARSPREQEIVLEFLRAVQTCDFHLRQDVEAGYEEGFSAFTELAWEQVLDAAEHMPRKRTYAEGDS